MAIDQGEVWRFGQEVPRGSRWWEALLSLVTADCRGYETVRLIQSRYAADPSAMVNAVISGLSQG
jgi:hypothetical protein